VTPREREARLTRIEDRLCGPRLRIVTRRFQLRYEPTGEGLPRAIVEPLDPSNILIRPGLKALGDLLAEAHRAQARPLLALGAWRQPEPEEAERGHDGGRAVTNLSRPYLSAKSPAAAAGKPQRGMPEAGPGFSLALYFPLDTYSTSC
jgi:hypothetical protein